VTSLTEECNFSKPVLKLKKKIYEKIIKKGFDLLISKIIIIVVVVAVMFTYALKQSPESKDKCTHLL